MNRRPRRSRFELLVEIIELCKFPGLSRSRINRDLRGNSTTVNEILFGLLDSGLLKVETRPRSQLGQKRETDFYLRTTKGDQFHHDFMTLKERSTRLGAQTQSEPPQSRA